MGQINSENQTETKNLRKKQYININSLESNKNFIKLYFYYNSSEPKFIRLFINNWARWIWQSLESMS